MTPVYIKEKIYALVEVMKSEEDDYYGRPGLVKDHITTLEHTVPMAEIISSYENALEEILAYTTEVRIRDIAESALRGSG